MKVIFSKDCINQLKAIKRHLKVKPFRNLYKNISMCIKSLSEAKSIDGRLKKQVEYDLSDLASGDRYR